MRAVPYPNDVINSATPLENAWLGVHPRLMLRQDDFDKLRASKGSAQQQRLHASLVESARAYCEKDCPSSESEPGDHRGAGRAMGTLAFAWKMTGESIFFESTKRYMQTFSAWENWGTDLQYGHTVNGYALALDWLWHDFDEPFRMNAIGVLHRNAKQLFDEWSGCRSGVAYHYAWNHHTVPLSGLCAAGCVLYGEVENISPWLNLVTEKLRCITTALGPDGVSPESMAYGAYFSHYLIRSLLFARDLLGVDLLHDVMWWREYPEALIHHTLPRTYWSQNSSFLMMGDTDGEHWYGPDAVCRVLAVEHDDGCAQWLADELEKRDAAATVCERIIAVGCADAPTEPCDLQTLPLSRHFEDQDLVVMRSDWSGDESVAAFRCGPSMSHSCAARFRNPVAGGHMHAFAGTFQIFAHGDYAVCPAGYTEKRTDYFNTMLVDGKGQLGESRSWFEDLPFRRGHATPKILAFHEDDAAVYVAGDCAPAYPDDLALTRFVRHFLYLRPDCWVVIDCLACREAVVFSQLFHSALPLRVEDDVRCVGVGKRGAVYMTSVLPNRPILGVSAQDMRYTNGAVTHTTNLLSIKNAHPQKEAIFATVIQTADAATPPSPIDASVRGDDEALVVRVSTSDGEKSFRLSMAGGLAVIGR